MYKDDLAGAKRDLSKAEEEPLLSPYVHNNLGLLYYRAGLNEKAKNEFNHVIEQKADLSEAYYNLGVLYDEPYVLADLYAWLESHSGFTRIPVVIASSNSSSYSSTTK
jgi:tetratricopeptide (TPR) repeat protein